MCRCPDACGRDFKRDIRHRYAHQERQSGFVAVVVKVVHSPCDRDAERDDPRALSRRRLGRRRLGRRWCGRWRRRRRRVWLEVGVEAAGPIGGVEAAIGCVDEGARREELATLCPRVIDVPAGGSKAQKLEKRTVTAGVWRHHRLQGRSQPFNQPGGTTGRSRHTKRALAVVSLADATPCTQWGFPSR